MFNLSVHFANTFAKILYLVFVAKTNKWFFYGLIGTSSSPYLIMISSSMFYGRSSYHKSILILMINCAQFTLELSNNILIGSVWSRLQAISPMLTAYLLIFPLIRWQDQSSLNMKFIILCHGYLLAVSLTTVFCIFHYGYKNIQPDWTKVMPNIGIGQKWIWMSNWHACSNIWNSAF